MKKTNWKKLLSCILSLSLMLSMIFSLNLYAEDSTKSAPAPTKLEGGTQNAAYDEALKPTLTGTIEWALANSADTQRPESSPDAAYGLPEGISLTKEGHLAGTPTKSGTWYFTLTENNGTDKAEHLYFLKIEAEASPQAAPSANDQGNVPPDTQNTQPANEDQNTQLAESKQDTTPTEETKDTAPADESKNTTPADENKDATPSDDNTDPNSTDDPTENPDNELIITSAELKNGTVGTEYTAALTAGHGSSLAWTVSKGTLPPGIELDPDGSLNGTPEEAGKFHFTLTVTDTTDTANTVSASKDFTLIVEEAPVKPEITTNALPDGLAGTAYEHTLTADGTKPISWKLKDASSLPEGMTLTEDGKLSGTPSKAGSYPFTIIAENKAGSVEKSFTLSIKEPEKLYTVTVTTDGNGIACPDISKAKAGTKITLMAKGNEGYRFKQWVITSGTVVLDNHTFIMPKENVSIRAEFKKITVEYKITKGAGGVHKIGGGKSLTFTCDGELKNLTGVYVDGELLKAENYTTKSGSTILTLKPEYLDKLKPGTHTLELKYSDGAVKTTFTISSITSVKTGDTASAQLWLITLGTACIIAMMIVAQRRKNNK